MEIITLAAAVVGLAILAVMALAPLAVDLPLGPRPRPASRRTAVPTAAPPSPQRCGDRDGGVATRPAAVGAARRQTVGVAF